MDSNAHKLSNKTELKLEHTIDTSGMWFAAVVLFAGASAANKILGAASGDEYAASLALSGLVTASSRTARSCLRGSPRGSTRSI